MYVQMTGYSFFGYQQEPALQVITTPDGLQKAENILKAGPKRFTYDTETNGLAWWKGDRICGAAFATRPTGDEIQSFYIPYRHATGQHQLNQDHVIAFQKQFLEDPAYETICHNIKFDEHMAHQDGLSIVGPRVDTMVEARLYHEDRKAGLKDRLISDVGDFEAQLYAEMLDLDIVRLSKAMGLNKTAYKDQFGYSGMDIWLCGKYACHDVRGTWMLHEFYEQAGVREFYSRSPRVFSGREFRGIYDIEMKLTEVLCDAERVGVPIDVDRLHQLYAHLTKEREIAEGEFFKQTNLEYFNLGSDDELRDRLLHYFKVPLTKTTKSGAYAVDSDVLGKAAEAYPVLNYVLRWKEVDKKVSTYTLSMLEYCDENGVLHGNFQQLGTNTGRLSCKKPNLQNQPSDDAKRKKENNGLDPESVKQIFMVQRSPIDPVHFLFFGGQEGMAYRLFVDYSQIELRVLGHYSQDPRMCQTYMEDGDIHDAVEFAVFGTGKSTPEGAINRRKAKVINFGLCLHGDTPILTKQSGLVPIRDIEPWHLVWDGVEWVTHDGLICRGEKEVITYDGLTATPDHEVFTEDGWKIPIGELASEVRGRRLALGEVDGLPVRYTAFDRRHREARPEHEVLRGRMHRLRETSMDSVLEHFFWKDNELYLPTRQVQGSAREDFGSTLRRYGAALQAGYTRLLEALQGAWYQGPIQVEGALCPLGFGDVATFGLQESGLRSHRQRRPLHPGEPSSGGPINQSPKRKALVYDLLNAGPRHRFTAAGKIVSNSYCMSPVGFARQIPEVTEQEAQMYFDQYNQKFPRVLAFRQEFWSWIRANGCQFQNMFGRTRHMPAIVSPIASERRRAERQSIATLIQGTAAELTKESMVRIFEWLNEEGLRSKQTLTVHDEIQIDGPVDEFAHVARGVKEIMEDYPDFIVPVKVGSEYATTNWAEKKEVPGL